MWPPSLSANLNDLNVNVTLFPACMHSRTMKSFRLITFWNTKYKLYKRISFLENQIHFGKLSSTSTERKSVQEKRRMHRIAKLDTICRTSVHTHSPFQNYAHSIGKCKTKFHLPYYCFLGALKKSVAPAPCECGLL